jgi:hypothetical protein
VREVTTNNFATLNRAVSMETDRYRTQLRFFNSKTFLNFCFGAALVLLAGACAWYIYKKAMAQPEIRYVDRVVTNVDETSVGTLTREDIENELPPTMLSTTEDNLQIRRDLVSLEQRDETLSTDIDAIIPPEKRYNAFTNISTETGETITTGRVFLAGKWDIPVHQYCYLDLPGLVGGTPLVSVDEGGTTVVETDNQTLIDMASKYCRFE